MPTTDWTPPATCPLNKADRYTAEIRTLAELTLGPEQAAQLTFVSDDAACSLGQWNLPGWQIDHVQGDEPFLESTFSLFRINGINLDTGEPTLQHLVRGSVVLVFTMMQESRLTEALYSLHGEWEKEERKLASANNTPAGGE